MGDGEEGLREALDEGEFVHDGPALGCCCFFGSVWEGAVSAVVEMRGVERGGGE